MAHHAPFSRPPEPVREFIQTRFPALVDAVNPHLLLDCLREISDRDRWNSFDRFRETSRLLKERFEQSGAEAGVLRLPTGGPAGDGRWRIQEAWDIAGADLAITHPVALPLADYHENPWTVVQWSAATPPEGIEGTVAIVDAWDDLDRLPPQALAGRIVLTRLPLYHNGHRWIAKGARVVISDSSVDGLPAATRWGKLGWGGVEIEHALERPVAFMLSEAAGRRLRQLCNDHPDLRVRARLDARGYAGSHDVVSGLLPGAADPQDEVWAFAHSSEPGVVDNASGVAACIGALACLHRAFAAGTLPRPKRSIRCLAGFECYGFFGYMLQTKRLQPPMAGVVVDCVGVKPAACDGTLHWHSTVPGSAEFVDGIGVPLLAAGLRLAAAPVRPAYKPFISTEDTLAGDPKYGFPCPYLGTFPYRGYHTSADTLDLIDLPTLIAATAAAAGYLYFLADADSRHVPALAEWYTREVAAPAMGAARSAEQRLAVRTRHEATLQRLQRWFWGGRRRELLDSLDDCRRALDAAGQTADSAAAPRPRRPNLAEAVPFRRFPLAPTYENLWPEIRARLANASLPKWTLYRADGSRTLEDIRRLLNAGDREQYTLEQVHAFFAAMAEIGYVALVPPEELIPRERLVRDLQALGLEPGMDLIVHSSLSRIGWVRGGPETVIDALLEVIGPEGTLMMPSFNHRAARVYNPLTTPTLNGAIPDAFWRRPEAVRSSHPTHALAAIGPKAEAWLRNHLEVGVWAAESPIGRLVHQGGWVLGLGVDHTSSTAYHIGEISMHAPCLDQFGAAAKIVGPDGAVREVRSLAWRNGTCPADPAELNRILDRRGVQRHGKVGQADCVLVRAIEVWKARREQIEPFCPTCPIRPAKS